MSDKTTCQICGRAIKASKGLIAHHGYKRPGGGWQTGSCFGARHLPYEVSCDLIPMAIKAIEARRNQCFDATFNLVASPPDTLPEYKTRDPWKGPEKIRDVPRPDGFDAHVDAMTSYISSSYRYLFDKRLSNMRFDIRQCDLELKYLNDRIANWKPARTGG